MESTRGKGKRFEDLAADYLRGKGYAIVDRNVYTRSGEIDIIARDGETIVFVEVRMRSRRDFGTPVESVTPKKMTRLREQIEMYLAERDLMSEDARLDIVSILAPRGEDIVIEHLENVYEER